MLIEHSKYYLHAKRVEHNSFICCVRSVKYFINRQTLSVTVCAKWSQPQRSDFIHWNVQFHNERIFHFIFVGWNNPFLGIYHFYFCVMPLFLEVQCVSRLLMSQCIEGGRQEIWSSGVMCIFTSVCVCVCILCKCQVVISRGSFSLLMTLSLLRGASHSWCVDSLTHASQSRVLVTFLHPLINICKWKLCVGLIESVSKGR